jgi:hypothetical protein
MAKGGTTTATAPSAPHTPKTPSPATTTVDPENILDHDIMMRMTSRNDPSKRIIKRPNSSYAYLDYIHDIPRTIVYGPMLGGKPKLENIFVKVLMFDSADQVINYMTTGDFPGDYWMHVLDTYDEEDMGSTSMPKGPRWDAALGGTGRRGAFWKKWLKKDAKPPNVDRTKIKIRRFDYFGHSAPGEMFLEYGWFVTDPKTNKPKRQEKGEAPEGDVFIVVDSSGYTGDVAAIKSTLKKQHFAPHAFAQLWGCFLGDEMAPALSAFFDDVVACTDRTNFEHILDKDTNMPEPTTGASWTHYRRPK